MTLDRQHTHNIKTLDRQNLSHNI